MTTDQNGNITSLALGEVIVVGTNEAGHHAGGAAAFAHENFGLAWGCGEGLSGQTYALPTMEGIDELQAAAEGFIRFATFNPWLRFYLTRVGCGIAGYTDKQIAPLFNEAPSNVVLPEGWEQLSTNNDLAQKNNPITPQGHGLGWNKLGDKQQLIERIYKMLPACANMSPKKKCAWCLDSAKAIATAWLEDREKAQDEAHYKGAHLALEKVAGHDPRLGEPSDELTTYVMTRIDADSFWWIANEVRHALTKTKENK